MSFSEIITHFYESEEIAHGESTMLHLGNIYTHTYLKTLNSNICLKIKVLLQDASKTRYKTEVAKHTPDPKKG